MRKKDILGNYVKNEGVAYRYTIKKLTGEFEGYSALIEFLPGSRELYTDNDGERHCLSAPGHKWLMYLPMEENWCLNAFYNPVNGITQWYFDISRGNFIDENGMPCIDDIYLDLVILPDGKTITLDADELRDALANNEITIDDYNNAYKTHGQILSGKWRDVELLTALCATLISEYDGL